MIADHHHTYACDHCHDHHLCLYFYPVLSPVLPAYAPLSFPAFRLLVNVISAFAFPSRDALVPACLALNTLLLLTFLSFLIMHILSLFRYFCRFCLF